MDTVGCKNCGIGECATVSRCFFKLNKKITVEPGPITPALINTVNGVITGYCSVARIDMKRSLSPVAVGNDEEPDTICLLQTELHHTTACSSRYFCSTMI